MVNESEYAALKRAELFSPHAFALFVKMLGDAIQQNPQGLGDKELQLVFEAHQGALNDLV